MAFLTQNRMKDANFLTNFKLLILIKFQDCANFFGNSSSTLVKMFVSLKFALLFKKKLIFKVLYTIYTTELSFRIK